MKKGSLHLIPVGLSEASINDWLPTTAQQTAAGLTRYIAENAKTARAFLKLLELKHPIRDVQISTLNAKVDDQTMLDWLSPTLEGHDIGLVSEAGCPAVADPGARVVHLAHRMGISVRPWVGPSSILLGLMASGLQGQRFAFNGYAPVKPDERKQALKEWEQLSQKHDQTQILIETPYRNPAMLETLLQTLRPQTRLCVASNLTSAQQWIHSDTISAWSKVKTPDLSRWPTLFIFQA